MGRYRGKKKCDFKHKEKVKVDVDQSNWAEVYAGRDSKIDIDQSNDALVAAAHKSADISVDQSNTAIVVV